MHYKLPRGTSQNCAVVANVKVEALPHLLTITSALYYPFMAYGNLHVTLEYCRMMFLKNNTPGEEQKEKTVTRSQTLLETNWLVPSFAAAPRKTFAYHRPNSLCFRLVCFHVFEPQAVGRPAPVHVCLYPCDSRVRADLIPASIASHACDFECVAT
jgi:hypothetical protein